MMQSLNLNNEQNFSTYSFLNVITLHFGYKIVGSFPIGYNQILIDRQFIQIIFFHQLSIILRYIDQSKKKCLTFLFKMSYHT